MSRLSRSTSFCRFGAFQVPYLARVTFHSIHRAYHTSGFPDAPPSVFPLSIITVRQHRQSRSFLPGRSPPSGSSVVRIARRPGLLLLLMVLLFICYDLEVAVISVLVLYGYLSDHRIFKRSFFSRPSVAPLFELVLGSLST